MAEITNKDFAGLANMNHKKLEVIREQLHQQATQLSHIKRLLEELVKSTTTS